MHGGYSRRRQIMMAVRRGRFHRALDFFCKDTIFTGNRGPVIRITGLKEPDAGRRTALRSAKIRCFSRTSRLPRHRPVKIKFALLPKNSYIRNSISANSAKNIKAWQKQSAK
jgi:hypothetical protein